MTTGETEGYEFTCIDCGAHVYRAVQMAANDDHVCVECAWIRDIEDPEARERCKEYFAHLREAPPP
jgi:hypothetical protein